MKLIASTLAALSIMAGTALAKPEQYDIRNFLKFLNGMEGITKENSPGYGSLFLDCPNRTRGVTYRGDALVVIVDKCTADKILAEPDRKEKFFKQLSVLSQEIEIYYLKTIIVKQKGSGDLGTIQVESLYPWQQQ